MGMISSIYFNPLFSKKKKKKPKQAKFKRVKGEPPYRHGMGGDFYQTREWRKLRWDVLTASDGRCGMCGRGKKHGVVLHVDHILPRSKYPSVELDRSNLQVLCEDCNLGKSATYWKA